MGKVRGISKLMTPEVSMFEDALWGSSFANPRDLALAGLALSGLSLAEVARVRLSDVKVSGAGVGLQGRRLRPATAVAVRRWLRAREDDSGGNRFVFPGQQAGQPITPHTARQAIVRLARRLFPDPNDWRRGIFRGRQLEAAHYLAEARRGRLPADGRVADNVLIRDAGADFTWMQAETRRIEASIERAHREGVPRLTVVEVRHRVVRRRSWLIPSEGVTLKLLRVADRFLEAGQ